MTRQDVYTRLTEVVLDVLDLDDLTLDDATTPADVKGWDSLAHIRVMLAIVGLFVMIPVAQSALDPTDLTVIDFVGLVVFTGVGLWLLRVAIKGPSEG